MSASINDKITDVRNSARPTSTTVTVARASAGTNLSCNSLIGWPTASKVHFVTYQTDTNNDVVAGTQLDCYGIVSGDTITNIVVLDGTDGGNAIGDKVEMLPTAGWGQDLADGLMETLERDGSLQDNIVTTAKVNNLAITTDKINTSAVTTAKIADDAITIDKIDYTTVDKYSATETNTGKLWVDARPIYRKVLRGGITIAATQTNNIAHGISGLTSAWEIINISGGIKPTVGLSNNGNQNVTLFYRETTGNWMGITSVDLTNIVLSSSYPWAGSWYCIILEYVK